MTCPPFEAMSDSRLPEQGEWNQVTQLSEPDSITYVKLASLGHVVISNNGEEVAMVWPPQHCLAASFGNVLSRRPRSKRSIIMNLTRHVIMRLESHGRYRKSYSLVQNHGNGVRRSREVLDKHDVVSDRNQAVRRCWCVDLQSILFFCFYFYEQCRRFVTFMNVC